MIGGAETIFVIVLAAEEVEIGFAVLDGAANEHREEDDAGAPAFHGDVECGVPENLSAPRGQRDEAGGVAILDEKFIDDQSAAGCQGWSGAGEVARKKPFRFARFASAGILDQIEHRVHIVIDRCGIVADFQSGIALLLGFVQFSFQLFSLVTIQRREIIVPGFRQRDS